MHELTVYPKIAQAAADIKQDTILAREEVTAGHESIHELLILARV